MTLDTNAITLAVGESRKLTATVQPENASNKAVRWSTCSTDYITVTQNGLVIAKKEGICVVTVTTQDGGKTAQCAVTITNAPAAPGITGPATMTLYTGYGATSTGAYTVTGTSPVTVTKTAGDAKITWNGTTKKLDIAAGLTEGTYPVTLKASNGTNPDATFTFTLTVQAAGGVIVGPGGGGVVATTFGVTFNTNGGSAVPKQSVVDKGKVNKPADPIKEGFTFDGWYTDAKLTIAYDFNTEVTAAFTLYAKWTAIPTALPEQEVHLAQANPFSDVKDTDWFYGDVAYVNQKGLMSGTAADKFSPHTNLTRAMLVTILWRLESAPDYQDKANPFNDVPEGQWYTCGVKWAQENGIVSGYGGGKFGPEDKITREQMVTILYNYCKFKGIDVSAGENTNILSYKDAFDISEWAVPAMQWACGAGIVTGKPGGLLDPKGNATRAEVAAVLKRCLEAVK